MDSMFKMIFVIMGVMIAFMMIVPIGFLVIAKSWTIQGKVVNVQYSAGGFMTPSLTTVYFADNSTLLIQQILTPINIGRTYEFDMNQNLMGFVHCSSHKETEKQK